MAGDTRLLIEKWAPWAAGVVLVAGIAAYATVHFTGDSTTRHEKSKLLPVERHVALEFVDTAVARKNLERAWDLAAPELKDGTTREEWLSGTLPVVPYPVAKASVVLRTVNSFTDTARLNVTFLPRSGTDATTQTFTLDLRKVDGDWLVSGWQPAEGIRAQPGG